MKIKLKLKNKMIWAEIFLNFMDLLFFILNLIHEKDFYNYNVKKYNIYNKLKEKNR